MTILAAAAAPLFLINPVLGVFVCAGLAGFSLGVSDQNNKNKVKNQPPPQPQRPIEQAIEKINQTERKVTQIASVAQQQKTVIKTTTTTIKQNTQMLHQSSEKIQSVAKSIESQTEVTQAHLYEVERLRKDLVGTQVALKACQKALSVKEGELRKTINELQESQILFKSSVETHHASSTELIDRTLRTHKIHQKTFDQLFEAKNTEIKKLEAEVLSLRSTLRTIDNQLMAAITAESNKNQTVKSVQKQASGHTQVLETIGTFKRTTPEEKARSERTDNLTRSTMIASGSTS